MSYIATAILGGAAITGGAGIVGSLLGSQAQAGAISQGINAASGLVSPFVSASKSVLPTLMSLLTPGPNQEATLSQTPGFQFAQDWGLKGILNAATARGGLGGNALTAAGQYASGVAQNTWQNTVSGLQNLYGSGAQAASSFASPLLQGYGSLGTANASGILGASNAAGGLGSMTTAAALAKILNLGSNSSPYATAINNPAGAAVPYLNNPFG